MVQVTTKLFPLIPPREEHNYYSMAASLRKSMPNTVKLLGAWKTAHFYQSRLREPIAGNDLFLSNYKWLFLIGKLQWLAQVVRVK